MRVYVTLYREYGISPDEMEEIGYEVPVDVLSLGTPDVPYLRNGDPGYPGDPPETEIALDEIIEMPTGRPVTIELTGREVDQIYEEAVEIAYDAASKGW